VESPHSEVNVSPIIRWLLVALLWQPVLALAQVAAPAAPPALAAAAPLLATAQAPTAARDAPPAALAQAGAPQAAAEPAPAQTVEEQTDLKIRTLEERVSDLKERIFRTKARLMNLQEMVIGGDITAGAKAVLVHRNEMGASFYLESVAYALDGAPIYSKADVDGDLAKRHEFEIFNGRIVPGNHQLSVQCVYRGGGFGLFSYLEGYKFRVQSAYTFNAEPGKAMTVKVVGFEKGGLTAELKDRPAVRYDVDLQREERAERVGGPDAAEGPKK
jgi:hypothetical protein